MKNDTSFKLVAAIVFAGVIVALFSPSHPLPLEAGQAQDIIHVASQAE